MHIKGVLSLESLDVLIFFFFPPLVMSFDPSSTHVLSGGCADPSSWGPILVSLQVPELTVDDFIQESLSLGSFLTLYVYIQQRLNLDQTVVNEKRTLAVLNSWLNQVFPRLGPIRTDLTKLDLLGSEGMITHMLTSRVKSQD